MSADATPAVPDEDGLGVVLFVAMLCLFPAALAAAAVGLGSAARLAYLAAAILLAGAAAQRSPAHCLGFVLWLFMLSPFVRRYVDFNAGWQQVSPIMLAPYAAALVTAPAALRYCILDSGRFSGRFLIVAACIAYGFGAAILANRLVGGGFEALRWAVPPLLCAYAIANSDKSDAFVRVIARIFLAALPLLGLYGIIQFVQPAPWDGYWMQQAEITSIGAPEAFQVRVFSTMNTPGAMSVVLSSGILFLLARPTRGYAVATLSAVPALLLGMQRGVFAGTAFGVAWLVSVGSAQLRGRLFLTTTLASLAIGTLFAMPEAREMVSQRIATFGALDQDESARVRREQYRAFPEQLSETPLGRGLGWESIIVRGGEQRAFVDSGVIQTFLALGFVAGLAYFAALAALAAPLLRASLASADPVVTASAAIVLSRLSELPLGAHHIAEHGVFLWTILGIGLARSA